jgi:hypothetical protein
MTLMDGISISTQGLWAHVRSHRVAIDDPTPAAAAGPLTPAEDEQIEARDRRHRELCAITCELHLRDLMREYRRGIPCDAIEKEQKHAR